MLLFINLIFANHPLSMAKAQEAVANKYFVEVKDLTNDNNNTLRIKNFPIGK